MRFDQDTVTSLASSPGMDSVLSSSWSPVPQPIPALKISNLLTLENLLGDNELRNTLKETMSKENGDQTKVLLEQICQTKDELAGEVQAGTAATCQAISHAQQENNQQFQEVKGGMDKIGNSLGRMESMVKDGKEEMTREITRVMRSVTNEFLEGRCRGEIIQPLHLEDKLTAEAGVEEDSSTMVSTLGSSEDGKDIKAKLGIRAKLSKIPMLMRRGRD